MGATGQFNDGAEQDVIATCLYEVLTGVRLRAALGFRFAYWHVVRWSPPNPSPPVSTATTYEWRQVWAGYVGAGRVWYMRGVGVWTGTMAA